MKYKTITKAGMMRKFHRLLADELRAQDPELYTTLSQRVLDQIREDNSSPSTPVQTWGIGKVKTKSMQLNTVLLLQKANHEDIL